MNLLSKPIYILELTVRQQKELAKVIEENKGISPEIILKNLPQTSLQSGHINKLMKDQFNEVVFSPYLIAQQMFLLWFSSFKYPKGINNAS